MVKTKEILPGWELTKIEQCCNILDSKRIPLSGAIRSTMQGDIPYYGANGLLDFINDYIFDEDLILMAEDGGHFGDYQNRTIAYKISGKTWINNHAHILKPNNNFDFDFIFYQLEHKNIVPFINGSTREKLNQFDLRSIMILNPKSKPEQTAIATILSKVDEAIEATRQSIKAAEKLKKALMQNLLTGKLKPDGAYRADDEFYEYEKFGKYPKDWNFSRFKDYAVLQRGKDLTDKEVITGSYPVVKSNGVQIHHNQYFVEPPGVVTGRSGTIGKVFYIEEKFWSHNTSLYVKDFKCNNPKFIYFLIHRMDFRKYYAGTTVPTLNRNDIHRLKIAIPKTFDEQERIATKIDEYDKLLKSKQTKIHTLQRLKKSLMQNLLTGKVRLDVKAINKIRSE